MLKAGTIANAHASAIHAVRFSASGEYIVSGGQDRAVKLWNPRTKQLVCEYRQHAYEVLDVAVSRDGSRLASVGGDKTAYVWDVSSATIVQRLQDHSSRINTACFNADRSILATGSFDTTVKLWDCRSAKRSPIQTLGDAKDSVSSVAVTDMSIISGSVDGHVRTYDMRNYKVYSDNIGAAVTFVKVSDEAQQQLLVTSLDSSHRMMDLANGEQLHTYKGHTNEQTRLGCTMFKDWIVSGSEAANNELVVWDRDSAQVVARREASGQNHAIDASESTLACSAANSIEFWN